MTTLQQKLMQEYLDEMIKEALNFRPELARKMALCILYLAEEIWSAQ